MKTIEQIINVYPELTILTLVILIERFISIPNKYTVSLPGQILARAIEKKVLTSNTKQAKLYGVLSLGVYFFLFATILYSLLFISVNDIYTQGLLLYASINYHHNASNAKQIQDLLIKKQKSISRALVSSMSEKNSAHLSIIGMHKLTLESLNEIFLRQWLVPIILFILINGEASLFYRLLVETHRCWPIYNKKTQQFGLAAAKLTLLIELPISWLFLLVHTSLKPCSGWFTLFKANLSPWKNAKHNSVSLAWQSATAKGCKTEMGGPFQFGENKITRVRINNGEHNDYAISELISWQQRLWLLIIGFNIMLFIALVITN